MKIDPLTGRETDILEMLADGRINVWIAEELSLSVDTVKTHVKNIHKKLNSNTNAKAVAVAFRNGILR